MAIPDWDFYSTGANPPAHTFSPASPIEGASSLIFTVGNPGSDTGTKIVKHQTEGDTVQGKTRTLFSLASASGGAVWGCYGMLQSPGTNATDQAYWAYIRYNDLGNIHIAKTSANNLASVTPLASGSLPSSVQNGTIYGIELEWQYDALNSVVVLFARFTIGTDFTLLQDEASFVDQASPFSSSFGTGIGIHRVASGSNPSLKIDNTIIFEP